MNKLHIAFRFLINIVCLALSTSLIIHFLYNLSDDPIYRIAVFPAVIVIELLAQYVLSMGRFYLKKKKYITGGALILCFVWYLVSFALFSALAYFNTEIAAQEQILVKTAFTEDINRQKWQQNNILIESLNKQLLTEAKSGYGSRSVEIMKQIEKLKNEQKELSQRFEKGATEPGKLPVDMFGSLAALFRFPVNLLKIFVFGTLVLFIYLGLTLTNWDIHFSVSDDRENATNQKMDTCPVCGKPFPPKTGKIYCTDKCRLKAFRINKEAEPQGVK
ncbi:MAG: hypothetical protein ACM3YE_15975 [Bacteroidota bacterium]